MESKICRQLEVILQAVINENKIYDIDEVNDLLEKNGYADSLII